jgi:chromatin remodeling complex protein RSC6
MVRTASSKPTTTSTPAAVAASSAASTVKKTAAPKKAPKESAAPPAASAPVPVVPAGEDENKMIVDGATASTSEVTAKLAELNAQVHQLTTILSATKGNIKVLEKSITKELKAAQKSAGKKKGGSKNRDGTNRKPSGFNIPTLISDELAAFLGKPATTKLARVEVTNALNTYIKANNLHDPTNGRFILPDAALLKLLKLKPEDKLSYFNLQAYIKHHFIKETPAAAAATA